MKATQLIAIRLPDDLAKKLDHAVVEEDTDKSKFIRSALRRHLRELGYVNKEHSPAPARRSHAMATA